MQSLSQSVLKHYIIFLEHHPQKKPFNPLALTPPFTFYLFCQMTLWKSVPKYAKLSWLFVPFSVTLLPATSESSTLSPLPDTQLSSHAPCSRPVIQANPSRAGPANQREFMGATTSGCGTCASSRGVGGACCSQPSDSTGTRCALRGVPSTMR